MTLVKDDLVELLEKDDNGWWLVKKDGVEGWAPSNYLVLVPAKPKSASAPPPPPPPPPASRPVPAATTPVAKPAAAPAPKAKVALQSVTANVNAKPVSVFPGMAAGNGSAAPWKKPAASTETSSSGTPASSRPSSSAAGKPPPPVAAKPKPGPPPVGAKPGVPKPPAKPPVPSASRPGAAPAAPPRPGGTAKPNAGAAGQMDLAAAVSLLSNFDEPCQILTASIVGQARSADGRVSERYSHQRCSEIRCSILYVDVE